MITITYWIGEDAVPGFQRFTASAEFDTPGDCASGELQPATSAANNQKASCFIGSSA